MHDDRGMVAVTSRDLRNHTRRVLARVEAGEDVTITVDGRPVALVTRVSRKPRWVAREVLFQRLAATAVALRIPLVSQDRDFEHVPGLTVVLLSTPDRRVSASCSGGGREAQRAALAVRFEEAAAL